jgi:uncharacterized integral membrane protein
MVSVSKLKNKDSKDKDNTRTYFVLGSIIISKTLAVIIAANTTLLFFRFFPARQVSKIILIPKTLKIP